MDFLDICIVVCTMGAIVGIVYTALAIAADWLEKFFDNRDQ